MDYFEMTAPCGLDCFNCYFFLAPENEDAKQAVQDLANGFNIHAEELYCNGCRKQDGQIPAQKFAFGEKHRCAAYECSKNQSVKFCCDCDQFPCDNLHPYADRADELPHNIKVFNLCLIHRIGLEKWAESKASEVRKVYFTKSWSLA